MPSHNFWLLRLSSQVAVVILPLLCCVGCAPSGGARPPVTAVSVPAPSSGAQIDAVAVTPVTTGCSTSDRPSLIVNGGFEAPAVPPRDYKLFSTGADIAGWTVSGKPGNVAPLHTAFAQGGFRFLAHGGQQSIDLTGTSNTPTGVSQTVATTPGAVYCLSFWVGNVVHPGGMFGTASVVQVVVDGQPQLTATNQDGAGAKDMVWQRFTLSINATSASTTIAFVNADPGSDTSNFVDDVTLN